MTKLNRLIGFELSPGSSTLLMSDNINMDQTIGLRVGVMMSNATFNNISVISWWSVLLLVGNRSTRKKHRPAEND